VVGLLEPVLNDDGDAGGFLGDDVNAELSRCPFRFTEDNVVLQVTVGCVEVSDQPHGKVSHLVGPDLAERGALKPTDGCDAAVHVAYCLYPSNPVGCWLG